jgi:hypothetical protein
MHEQHPSASSTRAPVMDARRTLDALLLRVRGHLSEDVGRGMLTASQADELYRSAVRRYSRRLGLTLPLTA